MRKLAILIAVGAAALMGGSAANAADNAGKAKAPAAVNASTGTQQTPTDISAQRRHYHGHRHHHMRHHHWGHHHRPYYRSYNYYAPRAYGYHGPRYYGGGPGVTFSFGSGGYRGW